MLRRFASLLLLLPLALTGCASRDRHEFQSTVNLPVTVTVKDPYSDTVYWTKDVPVGHRLLIDFQRAGDVDFFREKNRPAETFTWKINKSGSWTQVEGWESPIAEGSETLPGTPVLMKVSYRPAPEYPPGYVPPSSAKKPVVPGAERKPVYVSPPTAKATTPPPATEPAPAITMPPMTPPSNETPAPPTSRPADLLDVPPLEPMK